MLLAILIQEDEEGRISDRTHLAWCVMKFAFSFCSQFGWSVGEGRLSRGKRETIKMNKSL